MQLYFFFLNSPISKSKKAKIANGAKNNSSPPVPIMGPACD
jgi:hypothetical protein